MKNMLPTDDMDWLPDVSELIATMRNGSKDLGLPKTPPGAHAGKALPSRRNPLPPMSKDISSREISSRESDSLTSSRELPLRSSSHELPRGGSNSASGSLPSARLSGRDSSRLGVMPRPKMRAELPKKLPTVAKRTDERPKSGRSDYRQVLRGATGKDTDILASMAQRLSRVEKTLADKTLEADALQNELNVCRRALAKFEGSVETLTAVQENEDLKRQISEMNQFLADYGLTWVGEAGADSTSSPSSKQRISPYADQERPPPSTFHELQAKWNNSGDGVGVGEGGAKTIDIKYIESRVDALNAIAEKDSRIVKQNGVTRFDMDRRVTIAFYQNGLRIGDMPFFLYESEHAVRILQDIIDGYFPFCLKKQYPGGVPLVVKDATSQPFTDFKDVQKAFVERLPNTVINDDGSICDVRNQIQKRIGDVPVATSEPKQGVIDLRPEGWDAETDAKLCKIQVRDGNQSWVLHASSLQTIDDLVRGIPAEGTFGLRSAHPPKLHTSEETLESAGLVPNASLFVHRTKE